MIEHAWYGFNLATALIIGAGGQDGSFLTEILANQNDQLILGYKHLKLDRPINENERSFRINLDIRSKGQVIDAIRTYKPDVIYNLSSPGGVGYSYSNPIESFDVNCVGTLNILDSIVSLHMQEKVYLFQACSGEVFGEANSEGHNELSAVRPVSPYGTAKAASLLLCNMYRNIYEVRVGVGIMFNHESERREITYVTRKIVAGLVRWAFGRREIVHLGNVDIVRDWILASDAMSAANLIASGALSENFVISRGEGHSIRELIETSMSLLKIDEDFESIVKIDSSFIRRNEILSTFGDSSKLRRMTSWQPSCSFKELVDHLIKKEMERQGF